MEIVEKRAQYEEFEKTGNKDIFENIIDSMIMDGIAGMNESFRKAISSLPKDKKRLAILSILDRDRNLFAKIKESITDINLSKIDHVKNIILMLREYVKIAEVEKKKFGEVMTPLDLVKEMLNTLPAEVWSNPNLKWLDPANGTGPFPAVVIYKLMKGLESWEPDADKRYKHIIENMIYVCELQPKNMFLYLCTVDPKDELACNIYTGSFLDEGFDYHMKNVWGVEKFDVVIMNPPYQMQKEGFKKTQPIWHLFVKKTLEKLSNDGYLVAVHPSGWRNVDGIFKEIQKMMLSKDILYLNMNTFKNGSDIFAAKTDFDFYSIKNSNTKGLLSKVIDIDNFEEFIDLKNVSFIPNCKLSEVYSLVAKEGESKVNILYSRTIYGNDKKNMSKQQTEEYKYPCVYTVSSPDKGNIPTLWYSNEDRGHFGICKVIFASGASGVCVDKNGKLGIMNFGSGIADKEENLEKIKEALQNEYFIKYIMGHRNSLGDKYNRKIIATFREDFWKEFI